MGGSHDIQPFFCATFAFGDQPADAVIEDFCAGAGEGVEAGGFQFPQDVIMAHFFEMTDMCHFRRSKGMEFQSWKLLFQLAEQSGVIGETQIGVVAALEEELLTAEAEGLFDFDPVFVHGGDIGLLVTGSSVEVAKLTIGYADIGRIGIAVDDPGDSVSRDMLLPEGIAYIE